LHLFAVLDVLLDGVRMLSAWSCSSTTSSQNLAAAFCCCSALC